MAEATHREKMQVKGTLTTTMMKVFFRAFKKTGSFHSSI